MFLILTQWVNVDADTCWPETNKKLSEETSGQGPMSAGFVFSQILNAIRFKRTAPLREAIRKYRFIFVKVLAFLLAQVDKYTLERGKKILIQAVHD